MNSGVLRPNRLNKAGTIDLNDDGQTFTVEDVAVRLRSNAEYLRRECRTGRIRAVKIGKNWRIATAEFRRLLNGGFDGDPVPRTVISSAAPPPPAVCIHPGLALLPQLLDLTEAAVWLRVEPRQVRQMIRQGALPAIDAGGVTRIPVEILMQKLRLAADPSKTDEGGAH